MRERIKNMENNDLLILSAQDVSSLLAHRESEIIATVQRAYEAHAQGASSLPQSTFLRFPDAPQNRIIALPAYLGQGFDVAGIKWVASFPNNLQLGLERASAITILNSVATGQPKVIVEGSIINAKRTAASAALAAQTLQSQKKATCAGIIGCGVINFEVVRFLCAACPEIKRLVLFDLSSERLQQFKQKCLQLADHLEISIASDIESVLKDAPLISLATTSATPYISDISASIKGSTILHVSLRDLAPEVILACDNVADDISHVMREQTSVYLTEQQTGHRDFMRCTLADVLLGNAPARRDANSTLVFSPFGLGILDIAVGTLVYHLALEQKIGTVIPSFLPTHWHQRSSN